MLFSQAGVDSEADEVMRLDAVLDWFVAQDRRWKPATLRQYRAALRVMIEDAAMNNVSRDRVETWYRLIETAPRPINKSRGRLRESAKRFANQNVTHSYTISRKQAVKPTVSFLVSSTACQPWACAHPSSLTPYSTAQH